MVNESISMQRVEEKNIFDSDVPFSCFFSTVIGEGGKHNYRRQDMRTELEVSRIFVQFITSGVRHMRIDSYRKRNVQAKAMPSYPMELQLMDRLQLRQPARLLETIPINQISHLEDYIVNDRLSDAVARLNDKEKFVIYCKTVETMTDAEIGNLLGSSRSAISKLRQRIYKKLLKIYQDDANGGN